MLLAFFILHLSRSFVNAAPASLIASNVTATQPIPSNQLSCSADQRSIWDILWSCLATIFACTWVSIHPNIPPPNEKWWMGPLRRLELMIWAILAPELMILWAMRQWLGARRLVNRCPGALNFNCCSIWVKMLDISDGRWTKTHGYFVQMGGFPVFKGDALQGFVSQRNADGTVIYNGVWTFPTNKLPMISENEIRDRSKGDGLSKSLAIGQTLWFALQCIVRRVDGLYITELELATAAFAFLNGVIYFLWWDKPLAVQCSVPIQLLDNYIEQPNTKSSRPKRKRSPIHLSAIFLGIFDRLIQIGDLGPVAHPGTTFYAYTVNGEDDTAMIWASIAAVIFGGIHCAGWVFTFPSHGESILWRISSIVITGIPFLAIAYVYTVRSWLGVRWRKAPYLGTVVKYVTAVCIPFYMIARLLLLAEAFTTLRDLPRAAFDIVRWVTFIPHI
ncbi:hypothetical protein GALMADRAFT_1240123 [Galerina marginata CBS 339.88]|uniref:Uncharacterized protein n=1 Tax=Galerina marginata (strain CBS 339.88) TaxID=685588 RepID=A0A067TKI4_GALM3|nr:hypothetical protein GALMADRAFT_1240123 [Galerina marginata CBS 339.88]